MESDSNGLDKDPISPTCALAHGKLKAIMQEFHQFRESVETYQKKGSVAIQQVGEMHLTLNEVEHHMENLAKLGTIADTNQSIATNFEKLCTKIGVMEEGAMSVAFRRNQVPMPIFLIVVAVFAIAFLLKFIEDRKLDVTPTSFHIQSNERETVTTTNSESKKNP